MIERRKTREIFVGSVGIGGDHPISAQSMTNTPTEDVEATLSQIERLEKVGCEIARVGVLDESAAKALRQIRRGTKMPLVADIHFDHRLALLALDAGVDGLRINPGNIGKRANIEAVVKSAAERGIPIRIGVNAGSLEKDILAKHGRPTARAMVASALRHVEILEGLGFDQIKISLKASNVLTTVEAYRLMAKERDYPLHLGITEAGTVFSGTIVTSVGLGILLMEGIGDTIRVSLTGPPEEEVRVGWEILKSLGLRQRGVTFVSCPTCARQEFDVVSVTMELERRLAHISKPLTVAIMGCVVNGPGEARMADIGLAGGKRGKSALYIGGKLKKHVPNNQATEILEKAVYEFLKKTKECAF